MTTKLEINIADAKGNDRYICPMENGLTGLEKGHWYIAVLKFRNPTEYTNYTIQLVFWDKIQKEDDTPIDKVLVPHENEAVSSHVINCTKDSVRIKFYVSVLSSRLAVSYRVGSRFLKQGKRKFGLWVCADGVGICLFGPIIVVSKVSALFAKKISRVQSSKQLSEPVSPSTTTYTATTTNAATTTTNDAASAAVTLPHIQEWLHDGGTPEPTLYEELTSAINKQKRKRKRRRLNNTDIVRIPSKSSDRCGLLLYHLADISKKINKTHRQMLGGFDETLHRLDQLEQQNTLAERFRQNATDFCKLSMQEKQKTMHELGISSKQEQDHFERWCLRMIPPIDPMTPSTYLSSNYL